MEIPVTAGPWLVLGVVVGVLLPLLAAPAVLRLRRRRAASPPAGTTGTVDDLPGFLESPPGTAPAPPAPSGAWPALAAPPAPPALPPPPRDGGTRGALVAMAVTALLLVGAAAGVAALRTAGEESGPRPAPAEPPADLAAELTFEGLVLDRHPVGVTVAYPRVSVTVRDGRAVAEVELPTWNCLRDSAPADPEAAGCSRSVTEHAELSGPQLDLRTDGGAVSLSGAFPTTRRPEGSPPVATGRVLELAVTAAPRDGDADDAREPATGTLELGDERVRTGGPGPNEIRAAG